MSERSGEIFREPERPLRRDGKIEGKAETSFSEIEPNDMDPIPLSDIVWQGAALRVNPVGQRSVPIGPFGMEMPIILYRATLEFTAEYGDKSVFDFSDCTASGKPVLLAGDRHGFYGYDPERNGEAHQYYILGVQPDELVENMSRLCAVYHEIGHIEIYDRAYDVKLCNSALEPAANKLPKFRGSKKYRRVMENALPYRLDLERPGSRRSPRDVGILLGRHPKLNSAMSLFHERNAWAHGRKRVLRNGLPTGFEDPRSYFEYARLCLSSYERYHHEPRFTARGWK